MKIWQSFNKENTKKISSEKLFLDTQIFVNYLTFRALRLKFYRPRISSANKWIKFGEPVKKEFLWQIASTKKTNYSIQIRNFYFQFIIMSKYSSWSVILRPFLIFCNFCFGAYWSTLRITRIFRVIFNLFLNSHCFKNWLVGGKMRFRSLFPDHYI